MIKIGITWADFQVKHGHFNLNTLGRATYTVRDGNIQDVFFHGAPYMFTFSEDVDPATFAAWLVPNYGVGFSAVGVDDIEI